MRQLVTILAIFGFLATPPVSADEDPFDFSSPLPSSTGRNAKYFSRTATLTEQSREKQGEEKSTSTPETPARYQRERSGMSFDSPKTSAAELLRETQESTAGERPPTVSFSRELARQRKESAEGKTTSQRDPQEALRRFDEFLKSREVISAEYKKPADHQEHSAIRPVQSQQGETPYEELPSFGDLDALPSERPAASSPPPKNPLFEMRPAPQGQPNVHVEPSAHIKSRPERLTDPIPTESLPVDFPARDANPFAAEPVATPPAQNRPESIVSVPEQRPAHRLDSETSVLDRDSAAETSSKVQTSWKLLSPLNLGQECTAELKLKNTGDETADRVSLEVRIPDSVQIIKATPAPVEDRTFLGWKFAELPAGETQTVQIVFVTSEAGPLDLSSHVRHTSSQRESFTVTQPRLDIVLSGPEKVHVGEPATQTVIVKNPGSGIATNIKLQAKIPAGLEHVEGEDLLVEIGSLNPGEIRSIRLPMSAIAGGNHVLQVQANADSGLVQTAATEVKVIAPSLKASLDGPSLRYLGREAEYRLRVLNDGQAATDFVQVACRVPEGFDFVSAERGAKFDPATRLVHWYVGALESNQAQDLKLTLIARQIGEHVHEIHATSEHGAQARSKFATRVEGTASLRFRVADLEDPVEVGSETVYEITITNEGTASAHSVGLTCEIPRDLSLADAQGPSDHRIQGEMIGFRPVDSLPAGQSLTYRIHVTGKNAGDQRFRCRLTSESLSQPLFAEELTKFYAE